MLELLTERRSLWDHLRETEKPVYLYGMGDGADKIRAALARYGIPLAGVFASDGFVRGHSYAGFPVERYGALRQRHGSAFVALMAFAVNYEPMLSTIARMETECAFYAPDVPVVDTDGRLFDMDYAREHEEELARVWERLADESSRRAFLGVLNAKLSGKPRWLREVTTKREEALRALLCPTGEEVYVDLGAYRGDTVEEYLSHTGGRYGRILALEPDPKNFGKLRQNLAARGVTADCRNLGAWDGPGVLPLRGGRGGRNPRLSGEGGVPVEVDALDRLLDGGRADFIKLDVEGAEARALAGASGTIARCHPKLAVAAYHRNEDLFALPLQILSYWPGYRIYLRHHPYVPGWDTNYYCLP